MQSLAEQTKALRAGQGQSSAKKILIYGPAKKGKTAMAATLLKLPEVKRVFWFDMETGIETVQTIKDTEGNYLYNEEDLSKIQLINVVDYPDDPVAVITLLEAFSARSPVRICQAHGKIGCPTCGTSPDATISMNLRGLTPEDLVVIDSGTQVGMSSLSKSRMLNDYKDKRLYYADAGTDLNNLFTMLQAAPCHVVMIAHEIIIEEDKQVGKTIQSIVTDILPSILSRGYAKTVGKFFGHVIHVDTANNKFVSGSTPLYKNALVTGSRANVDFSEYSEPTLRLLFHPEEPDKPKFKASGGALKLNISK